MLSLTNSMKFIFFVFGWVGLLCPLLGSSGPEKRILVLGDSLTAGYGIEPDQAYPALLEEKVRSAGLDYEVVNAGVSGDTTAGGLRRVDWQLKRRFDVLILELGANDGLRGIDLASTKSNLQQIIDRTKRAFPEVTILIAGMKVPPNLGREYSDRFQLLFHELAQENQAALVPFLLEGVAGRPEMNLSDGIHPTVEGHKIVAETVWKYLEPLLLSEGR